MNISLGRMKEIVVHFLHRFHIILFTVLIAGCLGVVILILNNIVAQSSNTSSSTSPANNASFDQPTIDRLKELKAIDETPTPIDTSGGRVSPFVE